MTDATKLADELDAIFDRIEVSCNWRLSSEERETIAKAAIALRTPAAPTTEPVAWTDPDLPRWLTPHGKPADAKMVWRKKSSSATLPLYAAPPVAAPEDAVREALEFALQEIVLTIAFLGRDAGTGRLPDTIIGLTGRLAAADKGIRAVLVALPAKDGAAVTRPERQTPDDGSYTEDPRLGTPR